MCADDDKRDHETVDEEHTWPFGHHSLSHVWSGEKHWYSIGGTAVSREQYEAARARLASPDVPEVDGSGYTRGGQPCT